MMTNDLENELRNLKFTHLTKSEMAAYCDEELGQIDRARVEAHRKHCFICERQLELLQEESTALMNPVITPEDRALVERLIEQTQLAQKPSTVRTVETPIDIPLQERLAEYLRQMVTSWRGDFKPVRRSDQGEEVWRWQSDDGKIQTRATIEKDAALTVYFSSNEMELEGARLNIRLGKLSQEITLQRVSESEVDAKVSVPWRHRPRKMTDISIESVSDPPQ